MSCSLQAYTRDVLQPTSIHTWCPAAYKHTHVMSCSLQAYTRDVLQPTSIHTWRPAVYKHTHMMSCSLQAYTRDVLQSTSIHTWCPAAYTLIHRCNFTWLCHQLTSRTVDIQYVCVCVHVYIRSYRRDGVYRNAVWLQALAYACLDFLHKESSNVLSSFSAVACSVCPDSNDLHTVRVLASCATVRSVCILTVWPGYCINRVMSVFGECGIPFPAGVKQCLSLCQYSRVWPHLLNKWSESDWFLYICVYTYSL